jgi:hypothetical protein
MKPGALAILISREVDELCRLLVRETFPDF